MLRIGEKHAEGEETRGLSKESPKKKRWGIQELEWGIKRKTWGKNS